LQLVAAAVTNIDRTKSIVSNMTKTLSLFDLKAEMRQLQIPLALQLLLLPELAPWNMLLPD
jgi:hypothetical protein